jgi:hypothetical protein
LNPDSIGPVDPVPYLESGSRRAKMTDKSRKKCREISCFEVLGMFFLRAEVFFFNLDVLYGALGIDKL